MSYTVPFALPEWSFERAMHELRSALRFGIEPLVETVVDMLAELGNPDLAFSSVQVAGTNGKTSTSRYAAAILAGEGLRVGLYTSPELTRYTERMELDGALVGEDAFAHGVAAAKVAGMRVNARRTDSGERPYDITEFDLLTVAACVVFAKAGVDVAVLEVGMGGRWDATSAVGSIRSVAVTGIGLDHTHVLGDTLEAIAAEKAAVIKRGRTCVLGVGTAAPHSVEQVFLDRATATDVAPVLLRPTSSDDAPGEVEGDGWLTHRDLPQASYRITRRPCHLGDRLTLEVVTPRTGYGDLGASKPAYQAANIACAIVLAEQFLGRTLDADALVTSVLRCPTPGRFDVVRTAPLGLVDACHNPQSVRAFLTAVRAIEPAVDHRPTLLVAVLADKDVDSIVKLLAPEFPSVVATQTSSPRALPASDLAMRLRGAGASVLGSFATVKDALASLGETPFIACGSITLAGAVSAALRYDTDA